MAALTVASVMLGVTGATAASSSPRRAKRRSAWTERDPGSTTQRAQGAARNAGGEPTDERDLTIDTAPEVPDRALGAAAGARVFEDHDRGARRVRRCLGGVKESSTAMAQRAVRKIPQRMA